MSFLDRIDQALSLEVPEDLLRSTGVLLSVAPLAASVAWLQPVS